MKPQSSIFFHNYYGEHQYWADFFLQNTSVASNLYYNKVRNSIYNHLHDAGSLLNSFHTGNTGQIKKIICRETPNKGKDIGGKLVLLDTYQKLGFETDYGLFLHDKKSPYKAGNGSWSEGLLKIAAADFGKEVMEVFNKYPDVGIITAKGNVMNEYSEQSRSFTSTNKTMLPKMQNRFNIFPASFEYVAGTMFWFRMRPVHAFFTLHPPLQIRALLENGNVTDEYEGSCTHCWERLLTWMIVMQGYKIKTI